jgi:transglutaminase-like putative cysteine protease
MLHRNGMGRRTCSSYETVKTQKAIAVVMILASSVLTALACGDMAYPAILCTLGLLGLQRRFTWDIRPERRVIKSFLLLFLAIMFALQFRYLGSSGRVAFDQAAAVAWQTIARYFLASMILILFLGSPQQLPSSLGLFHVAITISAGQVLLLDDRYVAFRLLELLSVILVVLYSAAAPAPTPTPIAQRPARASGRLAFGLILLVAVNCGWITSSILYRYVEVLNYLPVWFGRGGTGLAGTTDGSALVGFSNSGKLSSISLIKGDQDPTPALSIRSDGCPGYLRAGAFDVYRESEWLGLANKQEILPQQNGPFGIYFAGRRNTFRLDARDTSNLKYVTIQHESRFADAVFTPLGTSFLEAPFHLVLRDENDIVYASNVRSGLNYRIAHTMSDYRKPPMDVQARRMLGVPRDLDPRIRQMADKIVAGHRTTSEKIDAVVKYFHANYTYSLGLDVPPDQDKLTYFLLEASTGYCEYFASGAAILLRLAGVPTRYVTGFLVTEQDPQSGLWIARNMDAHAWAEAWDRERNQWTTVEATVGEDAAGTAPADELQSERSGARVLLGQLLQGLYEYGLPGVISWLFRSYGLLTSVLVSTVLLSGALALALWRRYTSRIRAGSIRSPAVGNPALVTLHKMLARMDRKVAAAAGLKRHLTETLHVFCGRLSERDSGDGLWKRIADWYGEYSNLRYGGPISAEHLHELQQRARGLQDSL